jgi:D-apionolactonase
MPVEKPLSLRAGAATMRYENGGIRYIRIGSYEILRRVYVAVRDHNWGTVPARIRWMR